MIQYPVTFSGDLSALRAGIRDELARIVDPAQLAGASADLMRQASAQVEGVMEELAADAAKEFRNDISVPVDRSTKPPTRSKPGEFPRLDSGRFIASVHPLVYRPGTDRINAVVSADTPYAGPLNGHGIGGRFYTELTESKWVGRVEPRLTIALR